MKVAVLGAGRMGTGIARAFAEAGDDVCLHDLHIDTVAKAIASIHAALDRTVAAGGMDEEGAAAVRSRLDGRPSLPDAVAGADLVIEAVVEDRQIKRMLWSRMGALCPPETILATNTSSFTVAGLAEVTVHPERCVGMHFFIPAHRNRLVEVVRGPLTSEAVFNTTMAMMERIGKTAVPTADVHGFCINRFFVPVLNEACRIVDDGVADRACVDRVGKEVLGAPMGPFALMDLSGVAVCHHAQATLHEAHGPAYAPARSLVAQAASGARWNVEGVGAGDEATVRERLLGTMWLLAAAVVEEGVVTAEATDEAARSGLAWRHGPFEMADAAGVDDVRRCIARVLAPWPDMAMPGRWA